MKTNRFLILCSILSFVIVCAWAVDSQTDAKQAAPQVFNPDKPSDYPDLTNLDIDIKEFGDIGQIFMLEGIENSTSATVRDGTIDIGNTNYSNLVFHGVFYRDMRDWREEIINGEKTTRRIEVTLRNESGSEVLQIDFFNAFPVRYSLPPLSTENKTRFMERMEFAYSHFEIEE